MKTINRITSELGENACEREYLLSVYDRELKKVYKLILQEKEERWDELTEEQRNNAYKQNMQISMERMQQGFANVRKMSIEINDEIYGKENNPFRQEDKTKKKLKKRRFYCFFLRNVLLFLYK